MLKPSPEPRHNPASKMALGVNPFMEMAKGTDSVPVGFFHNPALSAWRLRLHPQSSKDTIMTAQAFWDRHAPKYAKQPIADMTAYEEKLRRVAALLRPTDRVLEIGCGTGGTARHLAEVAGHVTATDLSGEMIRFAKARSQAEAKAKAAPLFLQLEAGQDLAGEPFDAVCAFSLLHLVDDIPSVLDVVFRQVKPGGYFLSKTICLKDGPRWMQMMVRALVGVGIAPKVTLISRSDLTRYLRNAGFDIVETRYLGKKRINPFIVARRPAD